MSLRKTNLIWAMCANRGIGKSNDLPWKLKREFTYFISMIRLLKDSSKKNAVIMGRKTWESLRPSDRPMKRLVNVIITRQSDYVAEGEDVYVVHSLEAALQLLSSPPLTDMVETIWNLGGSAIYKETLDKKAYIDRLYVTRIQKEYDCDVFFPEYDDSGFKEIIDPAVPQGVQEENGVEWTYHTYQTIDV